MADQADKRTDIEKLLAEVDSVVDGPPARGSGSSGRRPVDSFGARMTARARSAAMSGVVAAVIVWVIFAVLPFLGAFSGAAGAFLATFATVLLLPRRG
jgi:hypothetical protein